MSERLLRRNWILWQDGKSLSHAERRRKCRSSLHRGQQWAVKHTASTQTQKVPAENKIHEWGSTSGFLLQHTFPALILGIKQQWLQKKIDMVLNLFPYLVTLGVSGKKIILYHSNCKYHDIVDYAGNWIKKKNVYILITMWYCLLWIN